MKIASLATLVLLVFSAILVISNATIVSADPDGPGCQVPSSTYPTISAAIADPTCARIQVAPGTYTEQLTITRSLELDGSYRGTTLAPSVLTPDAYGFLNIVEISGAATTVSISGFTISGPGSSACDSITAGIFVLGGATLNIQNSAVTNIHDSPAGGCQNGAGVFVGRLYDPYEACSPSPSPTCYDGITIINQVGHAHISNVQITNYQKGGIVVDNAGSTATIDGNTITQAGLLPINIAANGIQISRGAVADVENNDVSGNQCTTPPTTPTSVCGPNLVTQTQATGILLYGAGDGTVVRNNQVHDNDVGIAAAPCYGDCSIAAVAAGSLTIQGNQLMGNRYGGMVLQDGTFTIQDTQISGPAGSVAIAVIASVANTAATLRNVQSDLPYFTNAPPAPSTLTAYIYIQQ